MTPIRSERLALRLMTHADVDTYVAYRSEPATLEFMDTRVPPTADRVHAQVDATASLDGFAEDHWVRLAVTRADDDEMIGDVGGAIKAGGGVVDIGYVFRPEFRGQGYASEAVGALVDHLIAAHSIHRIEAVLSLLNPASMRVLESVGMRFESITKLSCCVDGVWEDDLHYAMTADDRGTWLGRNRLTPENVELVEVHPENADEFARLKTHYSQEEYVAPMLRTYRDALFPESVDGVVTVPWMRGIVADGEAVGFLMTSTTYGTRDGTYLWRMLIDRMHQRRGIGHRALTLLVDELRSQGVLQLYTSCGEGLGSPRPFYDRFGFVDTGGLVDDHETELVLAIT
jgi:RimJ/RimL family protein N-acetyltransferase/ribosomal protein S18 acetylase RimI-like enzyme